MVTAGIAEAAARHAGARPRATRGRRVAERGVSKVHRRRTIWLFRKRILANDRVARGAVPWPSTRTRRSATIRGAALAPLPGEIPMSKFTRRSVLRNLLLCVCAMIGGSVQAADIGQVKVSKGRVEIERHGATLPAPVGTRLEAADVVKTGADGSVGITMTDDSLLSAGPDSVLELSQYAYDPTTRKGRFEASLGKGTLAVVSGRIAKASPEAMTVRTPDAVLGVRGTEFVVSA
jgi:hypothetical protein